MVHLSFQRGLSIWLAEFKSPLSCLSGWCERKGVPSRLSSLLSGSALLACYLVAGHKPRSGQFQGVKPETEGTPLVVPWLRTCHGVQGMWVRSLIRELRSHMPWSNKAWTTQLLSLQPQLGSPCAARKILRAAAETRQGQTDKQTLGKKWNRIIHGAES